MPTFESIVQWHLNIYLFLHSGKVKDPFPPARIAAINAIAATQQFYTLAETSGKVVPMLCTLMSDPEKPVREQAFKVCIFFFIYYIFR